MAYKKLISSALIVLTTSVSASAAELNVLTWEGYADASFIAKFETESGCKVNATYVGSGEEIIAKLAAGGAVYDLIAGASDITGVITDAGFVEPIDITKLSQWNNIFQKFRDLPSLQKDGAFYAMPYTWGSIGFMYRNSAFPTPPTSLKELFDEKHKGRISLWDDKSAIYVAARANGDMNIYELTDAQLAAAKETLVKQKPLVRKYWTTAGELAELYANNEVDISNTWTGYISGLIKEKNIDVTEFVPTEKVEGWMDSWMIVKGSGANECTYKFLEMQSGEAGQCGVSNITGYSVANPEALKKCVTPEKFSALHMDDANYLDGLLFWKPLGERLGVYVETWNAVKAQ